MLDVNEMESTLHNFKLSWPTFPLETNSPSTGLDIVLQYLYMNWEFKIKVYILHLEFLHMRTTAAKSGEDIFL